jgi:hypothetical protein
MQAPRIPRGKPEEAPMHTTRIAMMIGSALFAATSVAGAQVHDNVPPGMMPSAGMCRVWIDGVPPGRQPAQTDCVTARRTAPSNARVLYGAPVTSGVQTDPRKVPVMGTGSDVRYDPRRTTDGRYDGRYDSRNGQYSVAERERIARERERERERMAMERERRAAWERERLANQQREQLAKEQRKEQKRREKEWKKSHKKEHGDHDGDDDDRRGRDDKGQWGRGGDRREHGVEVGAGGVVANPRAGGQVGCVDANRDGVCDAVITHDERKGRVRQ